MTPNDKLLAAIKSRQWKATEFNYGILTADRYVLTMQEDVGSELCYKYATDKQTSFDDILKKAARTLVYSNPEMVVEEKGIRGLKDVDLPKNTLMVFRHVLTTPRKDRDGDILRTQGAKLDLKMLLLFQHIPTLPIGKMLGIAKHNTKKLILNSCIVDMNALCHDAAVMVDNDMGRFSHGFQALEFEELGDGEGFDVKSFEIMEESLVSVPSNVDADTEEVLLSLVEGDKLTSPIMREYGKVIRAKRPLMIPGTSIKYKEDKDGRELECNSFADLKAAKDEGLIGGQKNEDKSGTGSEEGRGKDEGGTSKEADDDAKEKEASGDKEGMSDAQRYVNEEARKEKMERRNKIMKEAVETYKKSLQQSNSEKAGRVLSKANETKLKEAKENVEEVIKMEDTPRTAKTLLREASGNLEEVLSILTTDEEDKQIGVKELMARFLTEATHEERIKMLELLETLEKSNQQNRRVEQYRSLFGKQ